MTIYHITGINPEPWVAPEASIGRRNGKLFVQFHTSDTLRTYQQAVKEEIVLQNGHLIKHTGPLTIVFYLWRQLDVSESLGRATNRNWADSTNCQKALEDALQKILYDNDKNNQDIRTIMIAQSRYTQPHITIDIRPYLQPRFPRYDRLETSSVFSNVRVIDESEGPF